MFTEMFDCIFQDVFGGFQTYLEIIRNIFDFWEEFVRLHCGVLGFSGLLGVFQDDR